MEPQGIANSDDMDPSDFINLLPTGITFLFSSRPGFRTYTRDFEINGEIKTQSIFSRLFIDGLKGIKREDQKVTFDNLYEFITKRIMTSKYKPEGNSQFPTTNGSINAGKLVIFNLAGNEPLPPTKKNIDDLDSNGISELLNSNQNLSQWDISELLSLGMKLSNINLEESNYDDNQINEMRGLCYQFAYRKVVDEGASKTKTDEIDSLYHYLDFTIENGRYKEGERILIKVINYEEADLIGLSNLFFVCSKLLMKLGNPTEQKRYLEKAIETHHFEINRIDEVFCYYYLGLIYYKSRKNKVAKNHLDHFIYLTKRYNIELPEAKFIIKAKIILAEIKLYTNNKFFRRTLIKQSIRNLKYAEQIKNDSDPNLVLPAISYNIANAYRLLYNYRNRDLISKIISKVVDLFQDSPKNLLFLATQYYNHALKQYPESSLNSIVINLNLGVIYLDTGELEKSENYLIKAMNLDVDGHFLSKIYLNLAFLFEKRYMISKNSQRNIVYINQSISYYYKAQEINPEIKSNQKINERIKNLLQIRERKYR